MSIQLYDTKTSSATASAIAVGAGVDPNSLLLNILLELRVMNEYLSHQANTNVPVDEVRTEILRDII